MLRNVTRSMAHRDTFQVDRQIGDARAVGKLIRAEDRACQIGIGHPDIVQLEIPSTP